MTQNSSKQTNFIIGVIIFPMVIGILLMVVALFSKRTGGDFAPTNVSSPPIAGSSNSPTEVPAVTDIPTDNPTETSIISSCTPDYPPKQPGWQSDYEVSNTTSLEDLYAKTYGDKKDFYDLYAVVYYNNRKVLEGNSYHFIDPTELGVEKGWKIFLPPPSWIDQYRIFPIPNLELLNQDNIYSTINISGSSILYPLSLQIAECFKETTKSYQVLVTSNSTKLGLYDFCQGDVEIFGASEEITQDIANKYGCTGVNFLKFEVAEYPTTIFINEKNPYANDLIETPLTREELKKLLTFANSWNEIRKSWGAEIINRYYPSLEGGMFETVKAELFPDWNIKTRIPNLVSIEDDNLLIKKVTEDNYAIGFSGYENYQINKDNLRVLSIDNISPNLDTVNGEYPDYPLTRKLYLYTGTTTYSKNPLLRYFINYYLAYEFDFIYKLGYFKPNKYEFLDNPFTIPK